jgi:Inovirus Coat protein B
MKKIVLLSAFGVSAAALSAPSFAVVDPAIMTAITTGGTDAATVGGAILALVIAIAIYRHMRSVK